MPLTDKQKLELAQRHGLSNTGPMLDAAREAGIPFYVACALMEKESHGRNVYGNDSGGTFAGAPFGVNKYNWVVFRWLVITKGHQSNGVGPAQLTYKGFFTDMESKGLKPYDVHDNMLYGFRLLKKYKRDKGSWQAAGTAYNGSSTYGRDLAALIEKWRARIQDA